MKRYFNPFCFILFFAVITFQSCKPRQKQPFGRNTELENKQWILVEMNGKAIIKSANAQEVFIKFDTKDNTYSGSGSCNSINGMYTVQDDMIKIQQMASTKLACQEMQMESDFFDMLSKSTRYELQRKKVNGTEQENLILYNDQIIIGKLTASK